jgi:hypothetical protein
MKSIQRRKIKHDKFQREDILKSMIASFKIEGIQIPYEEALAILKKIEPCLKSKN